MICITLRELLERFPNMYSRGSRSILVVEAAYTLNKLANDFVSKDGPISVVVKSKLVMAPVDAADRYVVYGPG